MKVHHLNCGTMKTPGAPMVCHVLLIEASNALVLVDTGFGSHDCRDPGRVGPLRHVIRPVLQESETALHQIAQLGFQQSDVRHIVLTHFDFDHIGGLADFPDAHVHVTTAEARGAVHAPSLRERLRYRSVQWAHGPNLVEHDPDGESWRGFARAKALSEISDGVVLVPMPGHTRGHAAVAVRAGEGAGDRWVLHCGDAFYHHGALDRSGVPLMLRTYEGASAFNRGQLRENQARLAELYERGERDLEIVCAHDRGLFEQARG